MNKYIFKNVKYIRNFLIVLGILSVIATITGIIIPYFNGVFVDVLIYTQDFNSIIKLTMLIITIGVVDVVFNYIYNLTYIKVLNKVVYRTKMQLIEHLRRVSYLRLSKLNPVYLNQRINIDVIAVFQFFIENLFYNGYCNHIRGVYGFSSECTDWWSGCSIRPSICCDISLFEETII